MNSSDLANIIDKTVLVLSILIIARALMSWFPNVDPHNPLVEFLVTVTEPILAPIRLRSAAPSYRPCRG